MAVCPTCTAHLTRVHRSLLERLVYADVHHCHRCNRRIRRWRSAADRSVQFLFSRQSHCIQCGTGRVQRLSKRDRIDSMSKHPFSLVLLLTGAPINHCPSCRLQYHDWRRPMS
jgi:hypothetical protein